jgi:20S proteasome alpha/beta subunit
LPRVGSFATLIRKKFYNNKDRMMAGMICGGWDPDEGGQVYEVPLGGTLMQQKFAVGGSGSTYIYGLVDATYKEGMTKEECKTFVKTGTSLLLVACCAVVVLWVRGGGSNGLIVAQCLRLCLRHCLLLSRNLPCCLRTLRRLTLAVIFTLYHLSLIAISHAMARDGSSGGVIRLVVIDQSGIEKEVVLGTHLRSV